MRIVYVLWFIKPVAIPCSRWEGSGNGALRFPAQGCPVMAFLTYSWCGQSPHSVRQSATLSCKGAQSRHQHLGWERERYWTVCTTCTWTSVYLFSFHSCCVRRFAYELVHWLILRSNPLHVTHRLSENTWDIFSVAVSSRNLWYTPMRLLSGLIAFYSVESMVKHARVCQLPAALIVESLHYCGHVY